MSSTTVNGSVHKKKICVIGAGGSGFTAIKACKEEGFDVVCYEKTNFTGGLWRYHDEDVTEIASVARSTIINSSKEMSAFSDFPPPPEFPNYMHNSMMIRYLEMYGEMIGIDNVVKFKHEIVKVEPAVNYDETGQWKVTVRNNLDENGQLRTEIYDGVMVCTGHHVAPLVPTFPGQEKFKGKILHTHSYKKPDGFENKRVVVVGVGNSGGDAAVELSMVSKQVYLSTRRGTWIVHRVGTSGEPFDTQFLRRSINTLFHVVPYNITCTASESYIQSRFNHDKYNIKPKHRIFAQHIMVNDALPNRILSGTVIVKGDIKEFTEDGVIFEGDEDEDDEDKRVTKCDIVVLATGYKVSFPFLDQSVVSIQDNQVELYKYVFSPRLRHPQTLALIALAQPIGALFPLAEIQSRWFAQLMSGNRKLPPLNEMLKDINKKRKEMAKRYYAGARHTIQVDWIDYMDEIASLIGAKPNLAKYALTDPSLWRALYFGPSVTYQYRLVGPHPWPGARDAILTVNERIHYALNTRNKPKNGTRRNEDRLRQQRWYGPKHEEAMKAVVGCAIFMFIAFIISLIL